MKRVVSLFLIFATLILILFIVQRNQNLNTINLNTTVNNSINNSTKETPYNINISNGSIPNIPLSLPQGFVVHTFASGLKAPRDMIFSPSGTLLVSSPNSGKVYAIPDINKDGAADEIITIISGENRPHGLAFYNGQLFVAEVDKVVRYNWDEQNLDAIKDKVLFSLPNNKNHNSRTIVFDNFGNMYVSVGSTCNVCSESSDFSATVIISNVNGDNPRIFAKGLRNAAFIQTNPNTGEIWATGMARDNLGNNLPPDEINILKQGADYGWPYCYGDREHDNNFDPRKTHSCENTTPPIFQIPAHNAPLGLAFINSSQFPKSWQGDLLVSLHGSWNSSIPVGYKVVHLKVSGNSITGMEDFMTGFLPNRAVNGPNSAYARPVDLIFDANGSLYLSDDKSGNIFIIQKAN